MVFNEHKFLLVASAFMALPHVSPFQIVPHEISQRLSFGCFRRDCHLVSPPTNRETREKGVSKMHMTAHLSGFDGVSRRNVTNMMTVIALAHLGISHVEICAAVGANDPEITSKVFDSCVGMLEVLF